MLTGVFPQASVGMFMSVPETPVEIQSASFLQTPPSKYTCLGFLGITQVLARAGAGLVVCSRWMRCLENLSEGILEANFRYMLREGTLVTLKKDFAGVWPKPLGSDSLQETHSEPLANKKKGGMKV